MIAFGGSEFPPVCDDCKGKFPDSLLKACGDPFTYAMRLRTGEVIVFSEARIDGEFCHISGNGEAEAEWRNEIPFEHPRGIDVRISDIVWCCDAPNGS
jgi:hypothetical protein